uniref:C2H2-type domain-containing protein n=1 Tax=Globodera pallida TaxID=36090 RepID=A0A183BY04_GLOPA
MQQQPADEEESPIWAIDLFERRQFRNGNAEAQCLECGERFHTTEVNTMTGHIVQDHPQYAAKLLAKQLEFGGHQRMLKEEKVK